jgi:hypothetical protein
MHFTKNQVTVVRVVVLAAVALLLCSGSAWAQGAQVTYFDNNGVEGAPNQYVHVVNPGDGALCADIYVWRADQELEECCSCQLSPNGEFSFTIAQATANPGDGTATPPASGSIWVIADTTSGCSDSSVEGSAFAPGGDLVAWGTHVNADNITGGYDVTETTFAPTTFSSGEESEAQGFCSHFQSGNGLCDRICTGPAGPALRPKI